MITPPTNHDSKYGSPRITVELANICNLHCSYCLRDDDALYSPRAEFLPVGLLRRVIPEARDVAGVTQVNFTGGEPTLHPQFEEALAACAEARVKTSFVTNGWHFDRVWTAVAKHRDAVSHISFSIDGATQEAHDHWRGEGSFVRLIRAFSRCKVAEMPFGLKIGIRRDTMDQLEAIALFAARMGAASLSFSHLLPTSNDAQQELALDMSERNQAEQEIAILAGIFKMRIGIDVGYYNLDPAAPCLPLAGVSCNIDYRGRLTLCCNLSGFRGAGEESDLVADLNHNSFSEAYVRFQQMATTQLERRRTALAENESPDLFTGSPCLFCLKTLNKIPWSATAPIGPTAHDRMLPVLA